MTEKQRVNNKIRAIRKVIKALEALADIAYGLDALEHLDIYREFLQEEIAERETL